MHCHKMATVFGIFISTNECFTEKEKGPVNKKGGITIKSTPLDLHRAFPLPWWIRFEYLSLISDVQV